MAKGESSKRGPLFLHAIVSVLLLIGGAGLLGFGIYRRTNQRDAPFSLDYEAAEVTELDNVWSFVLRFNTVAIIAGAFLLVSGVAALVAVSQKCLGKVFRLVFFIMATIVMIALVGISAGAFYLLAKRENLDGFVSRAWEATVQSSPNDICEIEKEFQCRGFKDGGCTACPTGVGSGCTDELKKRCAPCSNSASFVDNGCWNAFQDRFRKYYILVGSVAAVLAVIALLDICAVCSL